jgi:Zn-dependent protease with chaperone function
MRRIARAPGAFLAGALVVSGAVVHAAHVKPGFNLFSVNQDIEIGKRSATEAERQVRLLNEPFVDRYLDTIVDGLARHAPGPKYPYSIKAVNSSEINAFSLPGGPMYVNRGLVEAARNEGELAGVLAHEMAHVVLRHATHQASKAYLGLAGLGILGGLVGRGESSSVINAIGGFGLNAVFLKHSRNDEFQADAVGAEMMAAAGYDPVAMASFFELLRKQQGRDPSRLEQFFSSHPPSAQREARIREQARELRTAGGGESGQFESVRAELRGMPPAPSRRTPVQGDRRTGTGVSTGTGRGASGALERPSPRFDRFEQRNGFFEIDYPRNWRARESASGFGVTFVPEGGVVATREGEAIINGVIINHYDPFERRISDAPESLEQATDDLVRQITRANPYLRTGARRRERIDDQPGYSVTFSGTSPVTREQERVILVTRGLADGHVLYAVMVAPGDDYGTMEPVFSRMVRSLRIDDAAAHNR